MRILLIAAGAGFAIVASSNAVTASCETTIVAHSIIWRGAVVCDERWLEREGSKALMHKAQACSSTKNTKALVDRGFKDFDRKSKDIGMSAACSEIDQYIRSFEH